MIKAAFLNETPDTLRRFYAERQMARLNKLVQLYPAVITSVDEARAARDALKDIEVVFSTWGMPAMTEAEIKDAIHRPVGARSIDAVKRRTRAGMGRCQGGFCSPRVLELLCEELHCSPLEITKCGGDSRLLAGTLAQIAKEAQGREH